MPSPTYQLSKNDFFNFLIRLGKIFSNISILSLILCFCGVISFAATAFILLIGLTIIILSIGTIFIVVPNYFEIIMSASQISAKISAFFLDCWLYFVVGSITS